MKRIGATLSLIMAGLLVPAEAHACRIPPQPSALLRIEADAIVLALIAKVEADGASWRATAVSRGTLMGRTPQRVFSYGSEPNSYETIVATCDRNWRPKQDRYAILYLRRTAEGMLVHRGYPYWWAKASLDPRLARLDRLLPLGAAREPTAEEGRLLDLAEARVELPAGAPNLSRYTRIYERASPSWVSGRLFRSRKPRRLIVDSTGELPTEASCRCKLINVFLQLDDLWRAGQLPPFNP